MIDSGFFKLERERPAFSVSGDSMYYVKDQRHLDYPYSKANQVIAKNLKDHWYRLVMEALRQGNAGIVEYAYQRTKNFERLSFLYLAGYKATTQGKFADALRLLLGILHTIPVIVVDSRREVDEVKELIIIVKEYVLGLKMEIKRKELKGDPVRQQEPAAYFTHCNLQMPHLRLALLNAMSVCYKAGNLNTAANFARRLLETNPTIENHAKTARQILQAAEKNMTDATQLNYDFRNPFVVCGATYVPIYRGQKDVSCPYCSSRFVQDQEGKFCTVFDLSVVGSDASGLLCSPT
ncbi:hypothetical protein DVH24_022187 [Malus domestica]|uniref:Coatomer alpha subunit C-terminal domain-containing protein n=1 Tax=Malus domestica TaxID=3750 RepID=A0A498IXR9_MALDO|nr:hypothetical protein DVH24_022187 [Malus domestica]